MRRLEGKVAVVTGAGRGIGRAVAILFAREGASVVVADIDETPAQETVAEIEKAGGLAIACVADVSKVEEAQEAVALATERFGALDILVNNAGIRLDALIHKVTEEQWDVTIDTNLKGTFNCIRAASKYVMKEGHCGRIINITSAAALGGNFGQISYTAAKAGLLGLTKTVAKEWSKYGITCNVVVMGDVDTRMTQEKETGEMVLGQPYGIPKRIRDAILERFPGGKFISPDDAAKPVLFLATDDASLVTGQLLNATGGSYM